MERAAILIGVDQVSGTALETLQAVLPGIKLMRDWSRGQQGMNGRVKMIAPSTGKVALHRVQQAVREYVQLGFLDQLIIYFAGHGINIGFEEFWLLTDAGTNPTEVVNLPLTVDLARHCGVGHVVFISDACRSPAATIGQQIPSGSVLFPTPMDYSRPGFVDVFYATTVGSPALEVRPAGNADYEAIYTATLVDGLAGREPGIVEDEMLASGTAIHCVKAWPLRDWLLTEVPMRLMAKGGISLNQTPDAIITSRPKGTWLSEIKGRPRPRKPVPIPPFGVRDLARGWKDVVSSSPSLQAMWASARLALRGALNEPEWQWDRLEGQAEATRPLQKEFEDFSKFFNAISDRNGLQGATRPGFVVDGARIVRAAGKGVRLAQPVTQASVVELASDGSGSGTVLVGFDNGTCALLPFFDHMLAKLSFHGGVLADVRYMAAGAQAPSSDAYAAARNAIATAFYLGRLPFRDSAGACKLVRKVLRPVRRPDLGAALYLQYLLYRGRQAELSRRVASRIARSYGVVPLDMRLLSEPRDRDAAAAPASIPPVPLLTAGWPLLPVLGTPSPRLQELSGTRVMESTWTLFNEHAYALIVALLGE
jgi:hypothetical protein